MALADSFFAVSSLGKIFLYVFLVLLGGAIAAPLAWHFVQMLPAHLLGGHIEMIQAMPFHRYFSRTLQVSALLMLWPLLRSLRIRSLAEFGLVPNPRPFCDAAVGFSAGLLCALLLQPLLIFSGAFVLHHGFVSLAMHALPRILFTAVVVAALEEFLFRGVLLGFFRQITTPAAAIVASSILFAAVHFFNLSASQADGIAPHWWSGLAMIGSLGHALPSWHLLAWAFATLFTLGMILARMTVRTGSLWGAIGLHGSLILGQQLFNAVAGFQVLSSDGLLPLFGPPQCNGMVPVGLVPLGALLLSGLLTKVLLRWRRQPPIFPTGNL
jgi:membrane protease YdiL (CAAX protease family)